MTITPELWAAAARGAGNVEQGLRVLADALTEAGDRRGPPLIAALADPQLAPLGLVDGRARFSMPSLAEAGYPDELELIVPERDEAAPFLIATEDHPADRQLWQLEIGLSWPTEPEVELSVGDAPRLPGSRFPLLLGFCASAYKGHPTRPVRCLPPHRAWTRSLLAAGSALREQILPRLRAQGPAALPVWRELAAVEAPGWSELAVEELAKLTGADIEAVLHQVCQDPRPAVRGSAARALADRGLEPTGAAPLPRHDPQPSHPVWVLPGRGVRLWQLIRWRVLWVTVALVAGLACYRQGVTGLGSALLGVSVLPIGSLALTLWLGLDEEVWVGAIGVAIGLAGWALLPALGWALLSFSSAAVAFAAADHLGTARLHHTEQDKRPPERGDSPPVDARESP